MRRFEPLLDSILTMPEGDLSTLMDAIHELLQERRLLNPKCYVISSTMTDGDDLRYLTAISGRGWRQCAATNLNHADLHVFSSEKAAKIVQEALKRQNQLRLYTVVTLDKTFAQTLPCATYKENRYEWLRNYKPTS